MRMPEIMKLPRTLFLIVPVVYGVHCSYLGSSAKNPASELVSNAGSIGRVSSNQGSASVIDVKANKGLALAPNTQL